MPRDPSTALPAHALFGTAHTLFAIIVRPLSPAPMPRPSNHLHPQADISQLADVSHIRYSSPNAERDFRQMASALELQLQEWVPSGCNSITEDEELEHKVTAAAIMIQWAALIRLHQIVEGNDVTHPKVRAGVVHILAALETIPPADLVESTSLLFFFLQFCYIREREMIGFGASGLRLIRVGDG